MYYYTYIYIKHIYRDIYLYVRPYSFAILTISLYFTENMSDSLYRCFTTGTGVDIWLSHNTEDKYKVLSN